MTIHVITMSGTDEFAPEDPAFRMWVVGRTDILKLQALVNRALNTAPEFGKDWFELAEKLDKFVAEQGLR